MTRIVTEMSDARLMQEVQAGCPTAMEELYDRFSVRSYRTAYAVCRNREGAQDALQDAFVAMWLSKSTYQPSRGSVAQWVLSIVRHRAIYLTRHRAPALQLTDAMVELDDRCAENDVPSTVEARASREQLIELLSHLPPAQQEVLLLGFFDGYSHGEIARRLSLPPGTVKGRMRLGLTKLRSELDAERGPYPIR